jgi:hypothetical protein
VRNANIDPQNWETDDIYLTAQALHMKTLPLFIRYIAWYAEDVRKPAVMPLQFQRQQVTAGAWTENFLRYNNYELEPNTYLPADYALPAYSLAPYFTVSGALNPIPSPLSPPQSNPPLPSNPPPNPFSLLPPPPSSSTAIARQGLPDVIT